MNKQPEKNIIKGLTKATAFVSKRDNISKILDEMFGRFDGAYSILSEAPVNDHHGKKYQVIYVEDSHSRKRSVWFDVTDEHKITN